MKKTALLLLVALVLGWAGCSSDSTVEVKNLRLEMKENPLGINVTQPRFSWQIASGKPDLKQTAYQIQVAASPEQLESGDGLLWDSGVVRSDESVLVPYAGKGAGIGKTLLLACEIDDQPGGYSLERCRQLVNGLAR